MFDAQWYVSLRSIVYGAPKKKKYDNKKYLFHNFYYNNKHQNFYYTLINVTFTKTEFCLVYYKVAHFSRSISLVFGKANFN